MVAKDRSLPLLDIFIDSEPEIITKGHQPEKELDIMNLIISKKHKKIQRSTIYYTPYNAVIYALISKLSEKKQFVCN